MSAVRAPQSDFDFRGGINAERERERERDLGRICCGRSITTNHITIKTTTAATIKCFDSQSSTCEIWLFAERSSVPRAQDLIFCGV